MSAIVLEGLPGHELAEVLTGRAKPLERDSTELALERATLPRALFRHGPRPVFAICLISVAEVHLPASYARSSIVERIESLLLG